MNTRARFSYTTGFGNNRIVCPADILKFKLTSPDRHCDAAVVVSYVRSEGCYEVRKRLFTNGETT